MHGMKACFLAVLAVGVSLHSLIVSRAGPPKAHNEWRQLV